MGVTATLAQAGDEFFHEGNLPVLGQGDTDQIHPFRADSAQHVVVGELVGAEHPLALSILTVGSICT